MKNCLVAAVSATVLCMAASGCGRSAPSAENAQGKAVSGSAPLKALSFDPAVRVLPEFAYGYEPTIVADPSGNLFFSAHKELFELALSPDLDSPTLTRSMSWARMSVDHGKTWKDLPGLTPVSVEQHEPGAEGDMTFDDAHHLYFTDTYTVDSTITRWTVSGLDQLTLDFTQPLIPTLELNDDRPWIAAHGDGHVFYISQTGGVPYSLGQGSGSGFGPGRYTLYASYDGGKTFDPRGYTLKDSGWCRPASNHVPESHDVYVLCSNDAGKLYSFVSSDDGHTFERHFVAEYLNEGGSENWPTLVAAADGTLYGLRPDGFIPSDDGKLMLYRSSDHGQTWTTQDITPEPGPYQFAWLALASDGRLGMSVCHRRSSSEAWQIYGAVWLPGEIPVLIPADPDHPVAPVNMPIVRGDYTGSSFGPDGSLNIVWNRPTDSPPSPTVGTVPLINEVWYAHTR